MNDSPLHILPLLGASADAVASALREKGIQGVRNTTHYLNPIVRFVQTQLRLDDYQLRVIYGDEMPAYALRLLLPDGTVEEFQLPDAVKDFLIRFNAGHFPNLEIAAT